MDWSMDEFNVESAISTTDTDSAIRQRLPSSIVGLELGKRSSITGSAKVNIPAAEGIEISIVVLTPSPIRPFADSLSPDVIKPATWGIMAAAMADENAMGILEMT